MAARDADFSRAAPRCRWLRSEPEAIQLIKGTPVRKPGSQSHRSDARQGHDSGVANTEGSAHALPPARALGLETPYTAAPVSLRPTLAAPAVPVRWANRSVVMTTMTLRGMARTGVALCAAALLQVLSGCTTTAVVLGAAGVASDTSVAWAVVKHLHAKLTEGDDVPCQRLDSVQRALNERCGAFVPGSLRVADLQHSTLQDCALAVAVREPRFWPALPEFIAKGASPEACAHSPLVELAQAHDCPDFESASPAVLQSLRWLAEVDARAIQHDVMRMLSCPNARRAGLDAALDTWLAQGGLDVGVVSFGPLGALDPGALGTPLARALEAQGHSAREALGSYDGVRPRGFELALRNSDWAALEWWLARAPELANRVPPVQGNQLAWLPLARVLGPDFLRDPASRADMVGFLLARGADPWQTLPYDRGTSVVQYARTLNSPLVGLLDPPAAPPTVLAASLATTATAPQPQPR